MFPYDVPAIQKWFQLFRRQSVEVGRQKKGWRDERQPFLMLYSGRGGLQLYKRAAPPVGYTRRIQGAIADASADLRAW